MTLESRTNFRCISDQRYSLWFARSSCAETQQVTDDMTWNLRGTSQTFDAHWTTIGFQRGENQAHCVTSMHRNRRINRINDAVWAQMVFLYAYIHYGIWSTKDRVYKPSKRDAVYWNPDRKDVGAGWMTRTIAALWQITTFWCLLDYTFNVSVGQSFWDVPVSSGQTYVSRSAHSPLQRYWAQ